MLKVTGKAISEMTFSVEVDVEDISADTMSMNESDELIKEALYKKYGESADTIIVYSFEKVDKLS